MVVPEVLAVTYLAAGHAAVHRARPGRLLLAGTDWLAAGRDGLAGRRLPVGCAATGQPGARADGATRAGAGAWLLRRRALPPGRGHPDPTAPEGDGLGGARARASGRHADRPLTGTRVGGALPSGRTGPTMTLHTLICHMLKNCKHNM